MSEVKRNRGHMERVLGYNPGKLRPTLATMRHTLVYERNVDWEVPVRAVREPR